LQGEACARRPDRMLWGSSLLVLFCLLGLLRFRLETKPQALWVGPGSVAAQDKAAYDASFGPFYRIAQLILVTEPNESSGGARPPVVSGANIELLFEMQQRVDKLSGARLWSPLYVVCTLPLATGGTFTTSRGVE
jgi:Niemann-Pick C1 protein